MSSAGRDALAALGRELDGPGLLESPEAIEAYLNEPRGRFHGRALAVARPRTPEQLSAIVRCCVGHGLAMVPQGGRTGLVGGASPIDGELIISLERMRALRSIDPVDASLVVEAGMTLARVREIAAEHGLLYPLSLASEGSASIGGSLATNAGGNLTIRYGNSRAQVLGLEAVLPDGRVFRELSPLRKDNSGYDLKQLLIGSEGTLGIITAACLRLMPAPRQSVTAMLALPSLEAGLTMLQALRADLGETLSACEFMPRLALDFVLADQAGASDPFDSKHAWYVVVQADSSLRGDWLRPAVLALLEARLRAGELLDAVLAESEDQARRLWALREGISHAQARGGVSLKHDIAVPVPRIPEFLDRVLPELERAVPGIRPCVFGHLGDGNLHFNLSQPEGGNGEAFRAREADCNRIVFDQVRAVDGSIAAEHGVGQLRRKELALGQLQKVDLMGRIKRVFDPDGLMNPGKVID